MGIDVGGRRKGFHLAALHEDLGVELARAPTPSAAADWADARDPARVAVDSPAEWAPAGEASRPCEREFAGAGICGIRFTPSEAAARSRTDMFYEWIEHGLELWDELGRRGLRVIECFPTASWTQWCGTRDASRAAWTRRGLAALVERGGLAVTRVSNQDQRDAVAAALTAAQAGAEPLTVVRFGALVVPRRSTFPLRRR